MPADHCPTCLSIQTKFAEEIAAGAAYRCSHCGNLVGSDAAAPPPDGEFVGGASEPPVSTAWEAARPHVDDIRKKAYWAAGAVTLLLAPSPVLITKVLGEPKAGLEEFITLWNVFWHTLPLTIAAAIDAGILLWLQAHPDEYPKTERGKTILWCWLGGALVGSMLLGGWLGKVELSAWSQARVGELEALQERLDPGGGLTRIVVQGSGKHLVQNKKAWPVVVVVGSLASLGNYFTLYGPEMFLSSLVVGAFLGWVWAIKMPQVREDVNRAG